ncbi:MAG: hypothetical protein ACR2F4_01420 [Thermoleophilaceae bacterium]|nr:hypothetical protein [Thermoleophilaceae bacterium]MDQ3434054.1 hypothetical protein [Actinomycetota bacterium]
MRPLHDPIPLLRHVLRAGDVGLAARLARALRSDPRYRGRVERELRALPPPGSPHVTPAGRLLDQLLVQLHPPNHSPG